MIALLDKVINMLKEKPYQIPSILFLNYRNLGLDSDMLVVLIYLINGDLMFNPKDISEKLGFETSIVLEIISKLSEKNIIKIELQKNNGIREEVIDLNPMYQTLAMLIVNDKETEEIKKNTIYDLFEQEFGRTLSPTEYQIITGWKEMNYSEELIEKALKEAVYNGVSNLRYIDKILYEWNKKGITKAEDVEKKNIEAKPAKLIDQDIMEYDWLNED